MGAAVTAITETTYEALNHPNLTPSLKTLCGPAQQNLKVLGLFREQLTFQEKTAEGEFYVVKGLKTNLLGLPTITDLHLIEKLCTMEVDDGEVDDGGIKKQGIHRAGGVWGGIPNQTQR